MWLCTATRVETGEFRLPIAEHLVDNCWSQRGLLKHSAVIVGLAIAALGGALTPSPAHAQDAQAPPPAPPRFVTEVVVTPERGETPRASVPASTVVLEAGTLPTLPGAHLSELMSFVPGFHVNRAQFHAGRPIVSARGFFGGGEAEYLLLLIDGVPVGDVESGLIDWSLVPMSSIRRVEAFRGPGASMYGDSAVGGVIQILTDRQAGGGELTATGGSFKTFTADAAYGLRRPRVGFNVSGAARRTDGAFAHSGGQQLVLGGSADGRAGSLTWRWRAAGNERDADEPGALSREQFLNDSSDSDRLYRFDALDRRSFSTAFTLQHDSRLWRPQVRVYTAARDEDLIRTILLAPGLGDRRARKLSSLALGGSLDGEHGFGPQTRQAVVRFGVDLSRENLDTTYRGVSESGAIGALNSDASGHRLRTGAFLSSAWGATDRMRLSAAVRWDRVSDDEFGDMDADAPIYQASSPRAGIVIRLADTGAVSMFSQVSTAFKMPTLDQLFDPRPYPDFRGGTFTISNRGLVPQRATNIEAGISGGSRARWSVLAYRMTVDNEIDFDVRTFSYANIGQSRHVGVELEAADRWGARVRPSVSYALSRVVDLDDNRQLKNVPRHALTVAADLDFPLTISAHARYHRTAGAYLDDESVYPIEGTSTVDLRVRRPIERLLVFVDALNVTDDRYQEYGFTLADFRGGIVPYSYSGAGRALRAGLMLSF